MILLLLATWIGLTLAEKRTERHGVSKEDLNNLTYYGLLAFVIGGRLSFVLQNIPAFSKSPLGIISVNPDIFDPLGGIAVAVITAVFFGQRREL
jgi:prolipoprotein diacylglyceryltransferase